MARLPTLNFDGRNLSPAATDNEDPHLAKDLIDNEEPQLTKLNTEKEPPCRCVLRTEREDPSVLMESIETVAETVPRPRVEREDP